tara:strand:- start:150 stop:1181 length:1032 start_codon:yes stop_codon:yes gene_type:complete
MEHELFMQRCFELAKKGLGTASPNPLVGSVVVYKNEIIGEGWHHKAGEAHAEVNAIQNVKDKSHLKESSIYVNLEPCSHFGKTPPCSDLLIKHQVKRVIIACQDPFSKVNGKGIQKLEDAGIEVVLNILQKEAEFLNRRFFTFHTKKRPYIILKWAQTEDGFIDKLRAKNERGQNWISGMSAKRIVHLWRSQEDGILVGAQTAINDNPSLTVREIKGQNPIRLLIDPKNRLAKNSKIFDNQAKTIHFDQEKLGLTLAMDNDITPKEKLEKILELCWKEEIQSIIVEGGASTLQNFIKANLWDEARVFKSPIHFNQGLKAPVLNSSPEAKDKIGQDNLFTYFNL